MPTTLRLSVALSICAFSFTKSWKQATDTVHVFLYRMLWGGGLFPSQLILNCRWYALLLTRSVNTQLELCGAWGGALDVTGRWKIAMAGRLVVEVGWQLCCLKDCWECLPFTGARSMGRAVRWSPMKPESELIQLVPT
jgi:hypothetical protein